ncbi:MAG: transcription termination/antitermination protein NusG [Candidatus Jidaibacter sp.]|nr:transcription termination/antitermination protein NusG [Candidatus Jidaibacter sp.]
MSAKWYIVNTISGSEHKVADMIKDSAEKRGVLDKFEEIIVPTENVTEVKRGKKVVSEKKIFPGYILVKMQLDDISWNLVKSTPKVSGFLGGNGRPLPVPEREVKAVLMQVEAGSVAKDVDIIFDVGENVKIIEGPFETFTGVVDEFDVVRKKLKISVSIFGRATPVELELHQVEKIK